MPVPSDNQVTIPVKVAAAMGAELSKTINVRSALRVAMKQMRDADVPSHALAAELLLMHVLGCDRAWLYAHPEMLLNPEIVRKYFDLVTQRAAGTPTQYLTGKQEFWGLEFEATPAVLIPRPETEHIIEVALERLGELRARDPLRVANIGSSCAGSQPARIKNFSVENCRIADVGTGSGCIAVALAHELPHSEIFATDISSPALDVARRNAERHGVAQRISFIECNLLDGLLNEAREFDLIVSNPPYVPRGEETQLPREIREHEPHEALFCGPTGAEIYAPLIVQSAELLRRGGLLVVEIGYGALDRVRPLLDESPAWSEICVTTDLAGIPRVISAERA
ncbi:MAG: peptide chain release factor N(5)-glutamine methyltransferase [Candidatus Acidiferrales bacterium]